MKKIFAILMMTLISSCQSDIKAKFEIINGTKKSIDSINIKSTDEKELITPIQTVTKIFSKSEPGQALIQFEKGNFSGLMTTREGFNKLKSNEKLYLSPGRVELFEPLEINNIQNIEIIGSKTSLVAKIDMPVVKVKNAHNMYLKDLLIVHEIGEWCAQNCIEFYDATNIQIEECTFDGSGYFGLALSDVRGARIEKNKFFNCEYGLSAWGCMNLTVKNNSFSNNRGEDIKVNNLSQFANDFRSENFFLIADDTQINGVNSFNQNLNEISKWDFIGLWNYADNRESLNISTSGKSDSVRIVWNSWTDGYRDLILENCVFENGKIYTDYYGAKRNFIVELKNDQLLLTINPFHEFTPIIKQPFQRSLKYVFKYINPSKNAIIQDVQKSVTDSLPSGDRLVVNFDDHSASYYSTLYYKNRFNRISSTQKKNWFIPVKYTSNIKPLFASREVQLKFFESLNKSEKFLIDTLGKDKIKQSTEIERMKEQNVIGQQKIKVDEEIFKKLSFNNYRFGWNGKYFSNFFIIGTVDLSPNYFSIVIESQDESEYHRFLVNYNNKGNYLDNILIGKNDYIESFCPIETVFSAGEVFVNQYKFSSRYGNRYRLAQTDRYILDINGRFLKSNYTKPLNHLTEKSIKVLSQNFVDTSNENTSIDLYLNYIDTINNGYVRSMHSVIINKEGLETIVPFDLSDVSGPYLPPNGDFYGPSNGLQKIFYSDMKEGLPEGLSIKFHFSDVTNDGKDELFMTIIDESYVVAPVVSFCFVNKGGLWVYSEFNEKVRLFNEGISHKIPDEMIFKSYYQYGIPPSSINIENDKKNEFLLKNNENLIYFFTVENGKKRVCIGVAENCEYLVYRFGTKTDIEFEFISKYNDETNKFNYYSHDQSLVPPRDELEYLSFSNENYQYALYSNYLESNLESEPETVDQYRLKEHTPLKNGIGIMVRNINTNKVTYIAADEGSKQGNLGLVKPCIKLN